FAAALSSLNFGWCLGEPNIPEYTIKDCVEGSKVYVNGFPTCLPMSSTLWGLVVGMVALGALVGSLVAGRAADRFGRKTILLVNNTFFIAGALLISTSTTVVQMAVGRFVSGIGCGVSSTVVATYNSECASPKVRGLAGSVLQLSVEMGIFFSQLVAIFLADALHWRIPFGLSAAISIVQLLWLPFMPESPRFLASRGRLVEASSALRFLRPGCNISRELELMVCAKNDINAGPIPANEAVFKPDLIDGCKTTVEHEKLDIASVRSAPANPTPNIGLIDIVRGRTPDVIWHPLFCTMFLMGFQQWSGTKGIVFYSTDIMVKVFHLSHSQIQHTPNSAQWVTIGLAGTGIAGVIGGMNLIDRLGRRRLLIISTSGMAISCMLVVIGCVFEVSVLAVFSLFSFKVLYCLGMAPIPWLSASELLPYYTLGTLSGIASALNWAMIFVIGLLFPVLSKSLVNYLFLPFACFNAIAFIVVLLFVPETKGRHISDIL
ncbi:general substrate transporter, partial [Coemansia reversa NRRL 1564]